MLDNWKIGVHSSLQNSNSLYSIKYLSISKSKNVIQNTSLAAQYVEMFSLFFLVAYWIDNTWSIISRK